MKQFKIKSPKPSLIFILATWNFQRFLINMLELLCAKITIDNLSLQISFSAIFSSPEPKAQVSYCHSAPSVVRPSVRPSSSSVNFHIFNFFSRTAWWILMKLGMHEVLMVPYKCSCFSARSAQRRVPFFKNLLLQTRRLHRQTECIAVI